MNRVFRLFNKIGLVFSIILLLICAIPTGVLIYFGCFSPTIEKDYRVYEFKKPDSDAYVLAKEWSWFRASGVDFFIKDSTNDEILIAEVTTNEYSPFTAGDYNLNWEDNTLIVEYGYYSGVRKSVTLDLSEY